MSRPNIEVGFAGLTHLAICSAIAMASKGCSVVVAGASDASALVDRLNGGILPFSEPGLQDLLRDNSSRIRFSADISALSKSAVVFVAPDVPTDDNGKVDLRPISDLIAKTIKVAGKDTTLVVLSQVPPGFTAAIAWPKERLFYQVETLVFGQAAERATRPERFIVGCAEPTESLPSVFASVLALYDCPILRIRYASAELAKMAINHYLAASVGVSNALADVASRIGADWAEIVPALRLDRRIGAYAYLDPGLGISGGNIERDLASVADLGAAVGADVEMVETIRRDAFRRRHWAYTRLLHALDRRGGRARIGILGLAYKANSDSLKNSAAAMLVEHLAPYIHRLYDPVVDAARLGMSACQSPSALDAVDGADAVAIMTPWAEFRSLRPAELAQRMRGNLVVDPFRMLDPKLCRLAGLEHHAIGIGSQYAQP